MRESGVPTNSISVLTKWEPLTITFSNTCISPVISPTFTIALGASTFVNPLTKRNGRVVFTSCYMRNICFLKTHITEIWDLSDNEKNIMCVMHYILFIFVFPKLPLHTSLSATITSQAHCHTLHVSHCPLFLSFFNPPHLICFYFFYFSILYF